jgi:hypothetical protein
MKYYIERQILNAIIEIVKHKDVINNAITIEITEADLTDVLNQNDYPQSYHYFQKRSPDYICRGFY